MEPQLIIGIDTGGTHTDAVVFNPLSRAVLASAKAETTHRDFALGIAEALGRLAAHEWPGGLGAVERLHLSTTLATNAIAENLGQRVGLILMGYDADQAETRSLVAGLPQVSVAFIGGQHDFYGHEEEPLDEAALREAIARLEPSVSGWAVSGFFSVKNPAHELAAATIIKSLSAKPVTLGRDLTGRLDAIRRAATAALNAGLAPIISRLLDAVNRAAAQVGLTAKLMVVKGDGSLVSEDWARQKPIETVVSGPAAGLVGARVLTRGFLAPGEKDLWVLDVGGTTSDLALLTDGRPAVNPNGARVGGWDTMTTAVETRTRGLGGDSFVEIDSQGRVSLGPRRVLPLCRLAQKYPQALETLRAQQRFGAPASVAGLFLLPGLPPEPGQSREEEAVLEALRRETPFPLATYSEEAFAGRHHFAGLRSLDFPSILLSAFTPTDAMAVLGMYNGGSREAAELGAALLGRAPRWSPEELARQVLDEFGRALTQEIVSYGFERDGVEFRAADFAERGVFGAALGRCPQGHIRLALTARETVVLLGAPAGVLAPFLGQSLTARVLVPPVYEVASAVGAAAAPVHLSRQVEIHTLPYFSGYRLFLPDRVRDGDSVDELVGEAERSMGEHMRALAALAGAGANHVSLSRVDRRVTLNDGSKLDLGATLTFTAESTQGPTNGRHIQES